MLRTCYSDDRGAAGKIELHFYLSDYVLNSVYILIALELPMLAKNRRLPYILAPIDTSPSNMYQSANYTHAEKPLMYEKRKQNIGNRGV